MRAHVCLWRQCNKDPSAALGMTVLGERIDSQGWCAAFFIWRCPKVAFKLRVTSHNNDTSRPLEKGRAEGAGWICPAGASFYVADNALLAGIVSHAWHEILRLSPHLFWLGLFSHRAFSSAQDDDTRGRMGSQGRLRRLLGKGA